MSALAIGPSAVQAFSTQVGVVAHNLANLQTPGFQPDRTRFEAQTTGGVRAFVEAPTSSPSPRDNPLALSEGNGVNAAEESVNLLLARTGMRASLAVMRIEDETLGGLVDLVA